MFKKKEKVITIQVEDGAITPIDVPKGIIIKVVNWNMKDDGEPDVKTYTS